MARNTSRTLWTTERQTTLSDPSWSVEEEGADGVKDSQGRRPRLLFAQKILDGWGLVARFGRPVYKVFQGEEDGAPSRPSSIAQHRQDPYTDYVATLIRKRSSWWG
jgi:hypothetical protein